MVALGDYEVGRTLGEGATCRVRLGRHKDTGQLVALKIVPPIFVLHGAPIAQAVRREIAVLRLIASGDSAVEGVLALHDVINTEESTVLALEYCDGGDLFEILLEKGRLPLRVVRNYFRQLARALFVCHQRGICHRDLKPENILVSSNGTLRIADFGMSGLLNPAALLETSCGSPHYCAPEVLSGQRYSGSEADVWSLGVILFAMITGGLPFDDDNFSRLTRKVCSGVFYMPPEVPDEVAALVRQMLVVTPQHRLSLEEVLQSSWLGEGELPYASSRDVPASPLPPVTAPDPEILGYLADLGLGNDYMLRRRLNGKRECLEREMYYRFVAVSNKSTVTDSKPSRLTSPTSITENVFKDDASRDQAILEESLAKMKLSEAFKEGPRVMESAHPADCSEFSASVDSYDGSGTIREYLDKPTMLRHPPLEPQEAMATAEAQSVPPSWLNIFQFPGNCV